MPNTLGHFGVQGLSSRGLFRRVEAHWIYLGCVLPDVPWILRRALESGLLPAVDPFELRLYVYAQASLAITLLLCAACAAWSRAPPEVFAALGLNALFHLLLDASQIKWGNGVLIAAPFSWEMTSFDLVWPESLPTYAITALGAIVIAWELWARQRAVGAIVIDRRRFVASSLLLAAYLGVPLLAMDAIDAHDLHYIRTLREVQERPGRRIEIDRAPFVREGSRGFVQLWTGERLELIGSPPEKAGRISLQGSFEEESSIRLDAIHVHRLNRDVASYIGLLALAILWLPGARRRGDGSPRPSQRGG